jgi:hypothetical protein
MLKLNIKKGKTEMSKKQHSGKELGRKILYWNGDGVGLIEIGLSDPLPGLRSLGGRACKGLGDQHPFADDIPLNLQVCVVYMAALDHDKTEILGRPAD